MKLAPRPWWLFFIKSDCWVSIKDTAYHPRGVDPATRPDLIAHEGVHIRQQQAFGWVRWLIRYIWHEDFMFSQEVEAIAAEVLANPESMREAVINRYAVQLGQKDGMYETADGHTCASSCEQARTAILNAINQAESK